MGVLQNAGGEFVHVRLGDTSRRRNHGGAGKNREPGDFERVERRIFRQECLARTGTSCSAGRELTMPLGQRVVIVGGGHNGLITAFYLARGGFKPVVLERREMVGGGAVTEEFYPGFRASTLAHTLGPL